MNIRKEKQKDNTEKKQREICCKHFCQSYLKTKKKKIKNGLIV